MPNGERDYSKLSWAEWKGAMGARVAAIEKSVEKLFSMTGKHDRALAFIAGKAAVLGAAGGAVVAIGLLIIKMLMKTDGG